MSTRLYKDALKDEQATENALITALVKGGAVVKPASVITDEMLDRKKADADMLASLNSLGSGDTASPGRKPVNAAAAMGDEQENQRYRRDRKAASMGHRDLMVSCMRTAYARMQNIQYLLTAR